MRRTKWLLILALASIVGQANAEGDDCPEPTPNQRKALRDKKLEAWKRDRRREAAKRRESVSHSMLLVTDDGHAVVREQVKTPTGCEAKYLRVAVSTSACEDDSLDEHELYVGCCVPRGCTSPLSWAYAVLDAVASGQGQGIRRFLPVASPILITDAQGQISPYRRTDPAPRFKEMLASLPHWTPSSEITCAEPKRESGLFNVECSIADGPRMTLTSSSGDLTDEKMTWSLTRVRAERAE